MKFRYRFSNLLGTVYRRGDVIFTPDGNTVLCPVGNKISLYDLANNRSTTLPVEARFDYISIALSPNGQLLVASQEDGEIHVINTAFKKIVYRKRFNGKIQKVLFSPCGQYFALSKHGTVFIYSTPNFSRRVYDPFQRVRVFKHSYDDVLSIDWSHDSRLLCFGSEDVSVHVCALTKFKNFRHTRLGGHRDAVVGIFFHAKSYNLITVTRDGVVSAWDCNASEDALVVDDAEATPGGEGERRRPRRADDAASEEDSGDEDENKPQESEDSLKPKESMLVMFSRSLKVFLSKHLKSSSSVRVSASAYKKDSGLLVVGYDSGDFLLLDMTDSAALIHSLNVSQKAISSMSLNKSGDWVGLGLKDSGELLVWEWQSETHVLKQKGHFNAMRVVAYSPDSANIATGGEDGKVKIWSTQSSFCFVTFSEHTSEVTGVVFTQSGKAVLSSSLDGTVRAFDLIRYRNFRTLASPQATQFSCLSVDSSGDLVAAGAQDMHEIFVWSLRTGKLLEVLSGHTGPVSGVAFRPTLGSSLLASTSWDKTAKTWNVIESASAAETVDLVAEGVCLAFRGDGQQLAVATMDGHVTAFDTESMRQVKTIEGRNDVGAGRTVSDRTTAKTNLKSKFFTTMSYSPEGDYLMAAGRSQNVCIYSVDDELLVKRFAVTENRSLDGMDKIVSRRLLADDGTNVALIEDRNRSSYGSRIPGSSKGAEAENADRPDVRITSIAFSNTGRSWAACTTEGLLVYSADDDWLFDPLQLEESNTPEAVRRKLRKNQYSIALMMAVRLNMQPLIMEVLEQIPVNSICVVVDSLSLLYVEALLKSFAELLGSSRHAGFYAVWISTILTRHGSSLKHRAPVIIAQLNDLQKALTSHYDNLGKLCSHNEYTLKYLLSQSKLRASRTDQSSSQAAPESSDGDLSDSDSSESSRSQDAIFDHD